MMKRIMACLLAIVCLLTAFAFAEGEYIGDMKVIKVNTSVNLRKGPSTDTASLGQVPKGAIVTDCTKVEGSEWIAVTYEGTQGYIRGDFLEAVKASDSSEKKSKKSEETTEQASEVLLPVDETASQSQGAVAEGTPLFPTDAGEEKKSKKEPTLEESVENAPVASVTDETPYEDDFRILDETVGDVRVIARQIYQEASEYLMAVGLDANGNELWKKETETDAITELMQTDAFLAGTADAPLLLMYNACRGLTAINPTTGEIAWDINKRDIDLGGSISHGVDENGIAYIGGYYGPDPVAIDAQGNVLWQASSGSEAATWLYRIELDSNGINCYYGSMASENSGCIVYDYNGALKEVVYD